MIFNEMTPAELSRARRERSVDPYEQCPTCAAVCYGNANCERCVLIWTDITDVTKAWLLRYAKIRVEWRY